MLAANPAVGAQAIVGHFITPFGFGVFQRPVLRLAQFQHLGHRRGHVDERRFAAFDKVERAGDVFAQRQQVQGHHVFDVHVGPDVLAGPDVTHHATFTRLFQQTRQLHAVAMDAQAVAVDQGVADDRRIHAVPGRRQDQVVDGHPCSLVDGRFRQVVFVVDDIAGLSARRIADDARTAGVQEYLIGTAQGVEQGLHRTAMVTAGGVDHGVGGAGLIGQ